MKPSTTLLLAIGLGLSVTGRALAQTELNSVPQPGRPNPAATPAPAAPSPAAPTPADTYSPAPSYRPAPAAYGPNLPAPDSYPTRYRASLTLEAGWGAPYGWGITYAQQLTPKLDLNGGLGLGVGGKIGVGARYFFSPEHSFTPYVGANLARSGRIDNFELQGSNGDHVTMSIKPTGLFHVRGGFRWQPGRIGVLGTLGNGFRLTGDPVVYDYSTNPAPSAELKNLAQVISPGGIEFSVGLVIGLGQ